MAQHTAWIGAGTAFLGIAGPDGLIDNGSDLIDSFAQLAALAPNNGGSIDTSDPIFSQLVVWEDLNGDGICQANEVFTLTDLGIVSISLNAITSNTVINGSTVLETATVTMADGTTREIAQVDLQASTTYTQYVGPITISAAATLLPQVQGYGTLMDLQHAMSADPQLLTDVQTLLTIDPSDTSAFDAAEQTILYEWAGLTTTDPNSRGGVFDAQKLGFIEALTGQAYVDAHGNSDPQNAGNQDFALNQSWNTALSGILARLLVQDSASALSTDFTLVQSLDYIVPNTDYVSIVNEIVAQAPSDPTQALAFWIDALTVLSESISDVQQLLPIDSSDVTTALQATAQPFFAETILNAAANGNLTFIDGSPIGAGSPDGATIYVTSDDLILITGAGMTIQVSGSDNEFIYQSNDGQLTLNGNGVNDGDLLLFAPGIIVSSVIVTGISGYICLTDGTAGDSIEISDNLLTASSSALTVQFADGTVRTQAQLLALSTIGTPGADDIYGPATGLTYDGKGAPAGTEDIESGQGGGDTFIYNPGYGTLEINEYDSGQDATDDNVLQLGAGITPQNIVVRANGTGNIDITDGIAGDKIILSNEARGWPWGVETVAFADGTTWNWSQLMAQSTIGTPGADPFLIGTYGGTIFDGKGAPAGSEDFLESVGNNNTFIYNPDYGQLAITSTTFADQNNTLLLGAGITPADVTVTADQFGNIYLADGIAGDVIFLGGECDMSPSSSPPVVQTVQFADGTTWSPTQLLALEIANGTSGADVLYGSAAPETFDGKGAPSGSQDVAIGGGGGDTFVYNPRYGWLEISEYDPNTDDINTLQLGAGITPAEIQVSASASGIFLEDGIQGDFIQLDNEYYGPSYGVQQVLFADGTTWTQAQLIAMEMAGTPGDDTLYGTLGPDLFDGQGAPAGSGDLEIGNGGGDTFIFNQGYGNLEINEFDPGSSPDNVLQLGAGISESDIEATTLGSENLYLTDGIPGDQIEIDNQMEGGAYGIQYVQFADGTTWTAAQLIALDTTAGTPGADSLYATSPGSTFNGYGAPAGAEDFEQGLGGGDTFIFNRGYGQLEISENDNSVDPDNVLQLGAGITEADISVGSIEGNLDLTDGTQGDLIILDYEIDDILSNGSIVPGNGQNYLTGVEAVQFADGTTWDLADIFAKTDSNGLFATYAGGSISIASPDFDNGNGLLSAANAGIIAISGAADINRNMIMVNGTGAIVAISPDSFSNYGTIDAEGAGSSVDVGGTMPVNYWTIGAYGAGASVVFDTDQMNDGDVVASGNDASVTIDGTGLLNDGTISATGSASAIVINGTSLTNYDSYTAEGAGATVTVNIDNVTNYDIVNVNDPNACLTFNDKDYREPLKIPFPTP